MSAPDYGDRIRERKQRAQDGQDAARRIRWTTRIEDQVAVLTNRVRRLARERDLLPIELRDEIAVAKHYHDHRIDEIWTVLVRSGLLPSHELHHTVRDNSDQWGRVEGCDHCEPSFKDFPWEGSLLERAEAQLREAHEASRAFWEQDDEGDG